MCEECGESNRFGLCFGRSVDHMHEIVFVYSYLDNANYKSNENRIIKQRTKCMI